MYRTWMARRKWGEFLGRNKVPCHTLPCYNILWPPSRGLISRYNDAGIVRVPGTAPALAGLLLRFALTHLSAVTLTGQSRDVTKLVSYRLLRTHRKLGSPFTIRR